MKKRHFQRMEKIDKKLYTAVASDNRMSRRSILSRIELTWIVNRIVRKMTPAGSLLVGQRSCRLDLFLFAQRSAQGYSSALSFRAIIQSFFSLHYWTPKHKRDDKQLRQWERQANSRWYNKGKHKRGDKQLRRQERQASSCWYGEGNIHFILIICCIVSSSLFTRDNKHFQVGIFIFTNNSDK